ncbi:tetratricopeptide repeat-containing sensor histidine kinase [Kordia sp. YSTF-M3]|uniref:histidine kinase n=1 Tax=Kordia aestuariivivens TaxID=2759037 RepID=A0ABR7Q804_9FLAO|nr:ATP-binding protein [Kordia aestuariivivens]MBC8754657.1 tetratricopeptide repeat-containing sensor histidine kinase [Kordia aestuariivivens]
MIKKTIFILFFTLGFSTYTFAQTWHEQIVLDSIKAKIIKYSAYDYYQKASLYFAKKKWDSTLVYCAKQLTDKSNLEVINYSHYYRGVSFQMKKIYNEAEKEFTKISKDFDFYYLTKMILGEIFLEQQKFQKALNNFKEIENISNHEKQGLVTSIIEHNIGICYLHLQQFDQAELYLLKSTKAQELKKDTLQLVSSYGDLANLYYEQYKDELAIPYFKKAYELSKLGERFRLKRTTAFNMAIVEENRKDFAKALTYRKEYEQWNDSLNNQIKIWETAQREKLDAIKEKQKEVVILEAKNKVKIAERNGFLYASIVLLILLGTGTYFYREKIKATKTIAAQKEILNDLNATKDYLFSVVSHDLRSPVNALRKQHRKLKDQIISNDLESLEKTIETSAFISESMYGLLNNILHWSLEQSKQLLFELKTNPLQLIIEQVLFDFKHLAAAKHISIETNFEDSILGVFDRESLKIVLRNLLDNAIKYTPEHGEIQVKTFYHENDCCIEIIDTGIGFSEVLLDQIHYLKEITISNIDRSRGVGLGLLLCVTLIKKNKGNFVIEKNLPKGSVVKIKLPKA